MSSLIAGSSVTKEQLVELMPKNLKSSISDAVVDSINMVMGDQMFSENFGENLLTYTGVLAEGKYKFLDYVAATKYVTCKMLNKTDKEAYIIAHPDRYKRMIQEGYSTKEISSYVSAYNKNKLVQAVMAQTMTATYVLNVGLYQEAIDKLANLMRSADSERVQMESADRLLDKIKPPEVKILDVNMGNYQESSAIRDLEASLAQLCKQQKEMIESKQIDAAGMARSKLVINNDSGDIEDV